MYGHQHLKKPVVHKMSALDNHLDCGRLLWTAPNLADLNYRIQQMLWRWTWNCFKRKPSCFSSLIWIPRESKSWSDWPSNGLRQKQLLDVWPSLFLYWWGVD